MITAYTREGSRITSNLVIGDTLPKNALWIDLLNPDDDERRSIAAALGINLSARAEMQAIEASSRLYAEKDALYMTTDLLVGFDTPDPDLGTVMMVLTKDCLVTMRYSAPRSIELFAERIKANPQLFASVEDGLMALLDAITDRAADILEILGARVNKLSCRIFRRHPVKRGWKFTRPETDRLQNILYGIGGAGEVTHKISSSINGMMRLLTFLGPQLTSRLNQGQLVTFKAVEADARSLGEHAQVLAQETQFLLDAALGQINVEQNNIIKIFSVVMVAFTPPTFFASMWGMNFHNMPEYGWNWGYAMALGVMLISGIIPLIYFRRRGWM